MKKYDLRVGMIVTLRNGYSYMVTQTPKDELFFTRFEGFMPIHSYNDDLTHIVKNFCEYDIMKVYKSGSYALRTLLYPCSHTHILLWERKETKEMTVAEISEALGYEVKVVK